MEAPEINNCSTLLTPMTPTTPPPAHVMSVRVHLTSTTPTEYFHSETALIPLRHHNPTAPGASTQNTPTTHTYPNPLLTQPLLSLPNPTHVSPVQTA